MDTHSLAELQGIEMSREEIDEFLGDQGFGVLSLADDDEAYGVPISFGYDGESRLYFVFLRVGEESKKEAFAERTETASFTTYAVESKHEWRSVVATGTFQRISGERWKDVESAITDNAWYPSLFSEADPMQGFQAWEFQIEEITGQASSD